MNRFEELQIADCQDIWSKLYIYYAQTFICVWGDIGETALRKAIRSYGFDRGCCLRRKQEEHGLEINVKNLFSFYDLPNDPRFKRNKIKLTEQERFSETLVCPIADLWKTYNTKELGRIYCEEFHHAMFESYEPAFQVNLSQTLTQDDDNHCRFSVYGRPANMPNGEFYNSHMPLKEFIVPDYRQGFEALIIRLSYRMLEHALENFDSEAENIFSHALQNFSKDVTQQIRTRSFDLDIKLSEDFINKHCPISINQNKPYAEWIDYINHGSYRPWELFYENVTLPLRKGLLPRSNS